MFSMDSVCVYFCFVCVCMWLKLKLVIFVLRLVIVLVLLIGEMVIFIISGVLSLLNVNVLISW